MQNSIPRIFFPESLLIPKADSETNTCICEVAPGSRNESDENERGKKIQGVYITEIAAASTWDLISGLAAPYK